MPGLYIDDLVPGRVYQHEVARSVTDFDNIWASCMTLNPQPLHISFDFAEKQTVHKRPIFNSMYTLGIVLGLASQELTRGTLVETVLMTDLEFPRPVFSGDTLYSRTTVLAVEDAGRHDAGLAKFLHEGLNQDGEVVAKVVRSILVRKRMGSSEASAS